MFLFGWASLVVGGGGLRESHSISWAGLDSLLLCSPG